MVGIFVWCGVGNRKGICRVEKEFVVPVLVGEHGLDNCEELLDWIV